MKSNKTGILILLICLIINSSSAQDSAKSSTSSSPFRFGLKISPSLAWLSPDTKGFDSDGSKLTFSWGFMADIYFAENYAFATGVNLTAGGGKFTAYDTTRVDYKLKYVDFPVTIKMRTNEIGYIRYFGVFGFSPGFNISAKGEATFPNRPSEDVGSGDINSFNASLDIGGGLEYSIGGNSALVVSLIYHNGFTDVSDNKDFDILGNSLALNIGFLF